MKIESALMSEMELDNETPGAWSIWFHPRRTRHLLSEYLSEKVSLSEECEKLRREGVEDSRRLTEALERLEGQRRENVRLQSENAGIAYRLTRLQEEVAALESHNKTLLREIEEYRSVEVEVCELGQRFKEVEEMKARYEQRIKKLKTQLRDTREALRMLSGQNNATGELGVIEMRPAPPPVPPSDPDWLNELPEF